MVTIDEDYVSFEIAKLLKEKGFDEHCFCINYPLPEGEHHNIILPNLLNNSMIPFTDEYNFCRYKEDFITIPTLQMTMKWLREEKNIFVDIYYDCDFGEGYRFSVHKLPKGTTLETHNENYSTYETTCVTAIKYCLENLI